MIVADTGAIIALIDADDRHHGMLRDLFAANPSDWVLPWAVLPEVDYLLATHVGSRAQDAFMADVATGAFGVEWGATADLAEAHTITRRHADLRIGLVDALVVATAERLRADAIATLDLRHFAVLRIEGSPRLYPRDL
ncbi:MAG TPA: PIN domain-containing protein [Gemmatimonadales bacterium]